MSRAVRLCPHLIIVRPDFSKYKAASQAVFEIFRSVTPLVEPLSLDEAYLDVTQNAWGEPLGRVVAQRIKAEIKAGDRADGVGRRGAEQVPGEDRVGLEEAGRPDRHSARAGRAIPPGAAGRRAVGRGAGDRRAAARAGDREAVDVRTADPAVLREAVGSHADWLRRLADGHDDRPVVPYRSAKSSGTENTFAQDLTDLGEIRREIDEMARDGAAWLERKGLMCRTVTIKVRYSDFTTITRSHTRCRRRAMPTRWRHAPWRCSKRPRPAAAPSACSAQRPQPGGPGARQRGSRRCRSSMVRRRNPNFCNRRRLGRGGSCRSLTA
jgi:DNA polymerase IV